MQYRVGYIHIVVFLISLIPASTCSSEKVICVVASVMFCSGSGLMKNVTGTIFPVLLSNTDMFTYILSVLQVL